jgi:adenosylcobinamide-GDP ribazoletransferase
MNALRSFAEDNLACLRFYTRLPIPVFAFERAPHAMLDFQRAIGMLPLTGALVGLIGAGVLALATALRLPPLVAAPLALAALVRATGAFHEDGLADSADGLGGGMTRERKLDIMKDSRIGTFGGAALVLSLMLRAAAMAALCGFGLAYAAAALVGVAAFSRAVALMPLALLRPARDDGLAYQAMNPSPGALRVAAVLAALALGLPLLAGASPLRLVAAGAAGLAGAYVMTRIAKAEIQGHTGDIAGASQQLAEIAMLLAFVARPDV